MYYSKFKNTLILIGILFELYVTAYPVPAEEVIDEAQRYDLVACVCPELLLNMSYEVCGNMVFNSTFDTAAPSSVVVRRQTPAHVKFQVEPSESSQVVILIPEAKGRAIDYAVVKPNDKYGKIITPGSNYTMWRAEITYGKPLLWRGGEKLPSYNESAMPELGNYNVSIEFGYSNTSDGKDIQLEGHFRWNTSGDHDVYFDVVDTCAKEVVDIWPNQKPETILKLDMNQTCYFTVSGLYGSTVFEYDSPLCNDWAKCAKDNLDFRNPTDIHLIATDVGGKAWQVRVNWTRPVIPPKWYKLALWLTPRNNTPAYTLKGVPGNVTEAVFPGVVSEGFYDVSITSYLDIGNGSHTSVRGLFPQRGSGVSAGVAAAWCTGAAAAALLAASCWRRRPARRDPPNHYYLQGEKFPKDGDTESGLGLEAAEDSWEVRSDRLLLHEVIGEGAFGLVRRGSLAPAGKEVAVKMLKDFPSSEEIRSFRSEMELMKSVGVHRNIVSLVGCCSGRRPLIIAEYCSRGDLLTYLRCSWDVIVSKRNAKYYNNNIDTSDYRNDLFKCKTQSENSKLVVNKLYELQGVCEKELTALDLISFCRQIAMGMEFLASNRVVHRDLAARNILVTSDKTLKIADFGLSRDVYEENQYKQKGNGKMPVKWMALESLTRRIYTSQSDVWSFGVVMWEVVTVGGSPYAEVPAARLVRLLRAGYRMPRPNNCSTELYELMQSCWRARSRERPTFAELHAQLDELLNSACADQYLSLEIEPDAPLTPKPQRYVKMLILGKRNWLRGESYERPLKAPPSNHYTSPPAALNRTLPV